jgi:hypothetical protein
MLKVVIVSSLIPHTDLVRPAFAPNIEHAANRKPSQQKSVICKK